MKPREIKYINHGIACEHDQPCPVIPTENAVLIMGRSYFQPSWEAQKRGYKIVKCTNFIQRFIIKYLFPGEFNIGLEKPRERNDQR